MRRQSLALILWLTLILVATSVHAGTVSLEWYTCTVTKTGPGGKKQVFMNLTEANSLFTDKTFSALKGREKEMLAVALTALTNNIAVSVSIDAASTADPPTIYDIFLMKP